MSILDECSAKTQRDVIEESYILLTNSKRLEDNSEAAELNVSSAHQMSQFEKALSKVGITNYHHLTLEELHNNQNIINILR